MLDAVISAQKKAFKTELRLSDSVEALLKTLLKKEVFSTAVLLFKHEADEAQNSDQNPYLLLFIFQNSPFATYRLKKDCLETLGFEDYFKILSQKSGQLSLYPLSPVLFKSLLVVAQSNIVMRATSDVIGNKRLIDRIARGKKELVLMLKKSDQTTLYYFREGKLSDGYFETDNRSRSARNLLTKLILQSSSSPQNAADLSLYEAAFFSDPTGQGKAAKRIESASVLEASPWVEFEQGDTSDPVKETEWSVEFLNGDKAGSIIPITQKRYSLGRGRVNLRLDDPQVSRHHADLEQSQGVLTLVDNSSTNGLFVNDEKVTKKSLINDDIIRLGDTSLKVVHQSKTAQAGASSA